MRNTHIYARSRRISDREPRRPAPLRGGGDDGNLAEETRHQRFRRLAERRVPNAIKTIRLVGNLSNKSRYEWTGEDARKVCAILREEVETVILQLEGHDTAFKLARRETSN